MKTTFNEIGENAIDYQLRNSKFSSSLLRDILKGLLPIHILYIK